MQKRIRLTTTKRGQKRAYVWSWRITRWLPIPRAEAELLLATGKAVRAED